MELLSQMSQTQILFPAAAVVVVLVCAALVFMFGFHTAEQPQFDKLPLVVDDRKSSNKKRKGIKEKKSSPNRVTGDDSKSKNEAKKSPAKEKKEEKVKEPEKPKPKEKVEPKVAKKPEVHEAKKGKKKAGTEVDKPADFDDGVWEEVPKKSDKKKVKGPEEKKESPNKANKKKNKNVEADIAKPTPQEAKEETIKVVSAVGPDVDEDATRALQAQVEELQRVLKEAERRDKVLAGLVDEEEEEAVAAELTDVKDLRSNKKKENKEKQKKKEVAAPAKQEDKEVNASADTEEQAGPVFDELGDTWTDAKVSKKSKKKARKDQ